MRTENCRKVTAEVMGKQESDTEVFQMQSGNGRRWTHQRHGGDEALDGARRVTSCFLVTTRSELKRDTARAHPGPRRAPPST
ncbi:hypothetical protein NDU88_005550 [Pleurodeles waltl]|uniref:Uncharacterized protein n=1 Tax=Pleurodeles waltl TaxID=8319 RepID=A0AAV7L2U9_PLEWA|nr:hypothetical protein NDU88_005550 [Pleurodeles waltl]